MPRPDSTTSIRPEAVAGTFYPATAQEVARELDRYFAGPIAPEKWRGALVPHAGWVYSARIATAVLQRIRMPDTAIILCPKHTPGENQWAIAPYDGWSIPGASIASNRELAVELTEHIEGLVFDEVPHRREHAIEVQLPLLARLAPDMRVVGITVGRCDLDDCHRFASGLVGVLRDRLDDVLLIVSSDMNHFANDAENRRLDRLAIEQLEQMNPEGLFSTCRQQQITMCGMLPAVIVLQTLRQLDALHDCRLVDYATSADVSGDRSRVVGYAGMLFR